MLASRALHEYRRAHRHLLAAMTLRNRTYTVENLIAYAGRNVTVGAIDRSTVAAWLAQMEVSASTLRTRLSEVRAFFVWCVDEGHLREDPSARIRLPRMPRQAPRAMKDEQIEALWNVLPDARARAIIALMAGMGLRAGEVAGLQLADFDWVEGLVRVVGKGRHERILPIPETVRHHVAVWLAERGRRAGPLIVAYTHGGGVGAHYMSQMVSRWVRDAGLKQAPWDGRSAHALRHSTAERLYQAGTDLRVIQSVLGHQHAVTTWRYLRHDAEIADMRAALDHEAPVLRPEPAVTPPPPSRSDVRPGGGSSLTCRRRDTA